MDIKPGYVLRPDQREDPILWRIWLASDEIRRLIATATPKGRRMAIDHFGPGRSKRLATWGRDPANPDGPHWIGVRNGTTLHTDPRYPRYTHQLVIHNGGWSLAGIHRDLEGEPFDVGAAFCCDTHSPHILTPDSQIEGPSDPYYLAASMDAAEPIPMTDAIPSLLRFVESWDWGAAC